jgi:hypothetical protein
MSQFLLVGTAEIRVGCRVHRKSRFVMPNKTFPAGHQSSPMSGYTAFCHRVRALLGRACAGFCRTVPYDWTPSAALMPALPSLPVRPSELVASDGDTVVVLGQHPADVTARFQDLTRQAGLPSIRLHDLRRHVRSRGRAAMKVVQT